MTQKRSKNSNFFDLVETRSFLPNTVVYEEPIQEKHFLKISGKGEKSFSGFSLKKFLFLCIITTVFIFYYFFLSDVRRSNPLKSPICVTSISKNGLFLNDSKLPANERKNYKLAGVEFPSDPIELSKTLTFLKIVTLQGVEIIRQVNKDEYLFRCEPKLITHGCDTKYNPKTFYKQIFLNEFLVACGYAKFRDNILLNEEERILFEACKEYSERAVSMEYYTVNLGNDCIRRRAFYGFSHDLEMCVRFSKNSENLEYKILEKIRDGLSFEYQ